MFRSTDLDNKVREELYYIISHLVEFGDKVEVYKMAIQDKILVQCEQDLLMEIQDQNLTIVILDLVLKLIRLGDEFLSDDSEGEVNPFVKQCCRGSELWRQIKKKTYDQHQAISNLSSDII